jgi:spermidine synthase
VSYVADGRRFLYDAPEPYDLIYSDVYSSLFSIPSHFTTKEFFTLAKSKLSPGGIFMANIIGATEPVEYSFLLSEIRTMKEVFPGMAVVAVADAKQQTPQNFVFIGRQDDKPLDAAAIAAKVPQEGVYATLPAHLLDLASLPLKEHALLTDDYAPVEKLTANFLHNQHARP